MKKLIIASLLLFASQGIFAQLDWSQLSEEYSDMYLLAERVSEQTDRVVADENGVSLSGTAGPILFKRELDLKAKKEHFKYSLIKPDGTRIPLDKVFTETVIKKYTTLLNKVNKDLKVNRGAQVEELLNSLFSSPAAE